MPPTKMERLTCTLCVVVLRTVSSISNRTLSFAHVLNRISFRRGTCYTCMLRFFRGGKKASCEKGRAPFFFTQSPAVAQQKPNRNRCVSLSLYPILLSGIIQIVFLWMNDTFDASEERGISNGEKEKWIRVPFQSMEIWSQQLMCTILSRDTDKHKRGSFMRTKHNV